METIEFKIHEDFLQQLADRFNAFIKMLVNPCIIVLDIQSCGGYVQVLEDMEPLIKQKKAEGYIFVTNVDNYAYSCGLYLFLLGDIKLCDDEARFMYHSAGLDLNQRVTIHDVREIAQELEHCDQVANRIVKENTTATPEILSMLNRNENYLSKEDLIYLGFMEREYELI